MCRGLPKRLLANRLASFIPFTHSFIDKLTSAASHRLFTSPTPTPTLCSCLKSGPFSNAFGMQTVYGVAKPVYRAFQLLKNAGNQFTTATMQHTSGGRFCVCAGIIILGEDTFCLPSFQCRLSPSPSLHTLTHTHSLSHTHTHTHTLSRSLNCSRHLSRHLSRHHNNTTCCLSCTAQITWLLQAHQQFQCGQL